jgi:hypothetical protein
MAAPRSRRLFKFWLNILNDADYEIAEFLEFSKRRREYTGLIRDGVRLILSLRQGRTDVLFELFPWLRAEVSTLSPQVSHSTVLQHQLERLEQLMLQQGAVPVGISPQSETAGQGPKALDVPRFDLPIIEDDDEDNTVILKRDTSSNSAMNFINSMLNLQQ